MDVMVVKDYEEMSDVAAQMVISAIQEKPEFVLGLATGTTPLGLYSRLAEANKAGKVDFSKVTTFNLDEYVGIAPDHVQSYRYFMNHNLFDHINIDKVNTHVPDGLAKGLHQFCRDYEKMIADAGGIDVQVLGIGRDGHLGFNEPGTSLASTTQVVTLTEETIEDNSRLFDSPDDVPRFAVTMGIRTILGARVCLMMANGENKADALKGCVEGPLTAMNTASSLQIHPSAIVIADEPAASKLERLDYYKWCRQAKAQLIKLM